MQQMRGYTKINMWFQANEKKSNHRTLLYSLLYSLFEPLQSRFIFCDAGVRTHHVTPAI